MKNCKKIIALLLMTLIFVSSAATIFATEAKQNVMTVLGDSIASGYGLDNINDSYSAIITEAKSYETFNYAVPGHKTSDLINVLNNNSAAIETLKKSDLIVISIGGNDLLGALGNASTSDMLDVMFNGANSKVVKSLLASVETNLNTIFTRIRKLNADAPIIIQNMYNPLYANAQYSAYADIVDGFAPNFNNLFINMTKTYSKVYLTDIYTAFDNYYDKNKSYDIIHSDGIHPSKKGHALIADVILGDITKLEDAGILTAAPDFFYYLGDADNSGSVTISDATTIQKFLADLVVFKDDVARLCADTDQDDTVTIKDATQIQKYLAQLDCNENIGTYVAHYSK